MVYILNTKTERCVAAYGMNSQNVNSYFDAVEMYAKENGLVVDDLGGVPSKDGYCIATASWH